MRTILFVDDEPKVLQGLERMLRPMRHEWEMVFTESAAGALKVLAEQSVDVVVSDMRMPGVDGAQLLAEVMRRYPQIVRIVLSGHSQEEMVLRSVGPTHQYLAKPCDPELLRGVIARACALRDLLQEESLRKLVSQMNTIPSLPQTYVQMVEELQSPDVSMHKIGQIIAKDVGMTAKVLQLVNSAFFGTRRHVSDPSQAAALLGCDTLKALVLTVHVFSQFDLSKVGGLGLDALWNHSVAAGTLAKRIAAIEECPGQLRDYALMAGLIHDAGKLIIAANLPERYREVLDVAHETGSELRAAEQQVLATTHAEVGGYLLGLWGLPDPIVEAVAFHHCPTDCAAVGFSPLTAVHVANALEHGAGDVLDGAGAALLDVDYLARIGLAERLPAWQEAYQVVEPEGATR